jgi:hypothetical protein
MAFFAVSKYVHDRLDAFYQQQTDGTAAGPKKLKSKSKVTID